MNTLQRRDIVRSYILSPAEAFEAEQAAQEYERNAPKLFWCNNALANHLSPILPVDFIGFMAYTGNGKTRISLSQAYHQAKRLMDEGKDLTNCVVYYTFDQPAEDLEKLVRKMLTRDLAAHGKQYSMLERMRFPLWFAGKNRVNQRKNGYRLPPLTTDLLDEVLTEIMDGEKRPSLVVFDFIQRVMLNKNAERQDTVLRAAEYLSDFLARHEVPGIIPIQSARTVFNRQDKTPMIHEAQWSSGIEQMCSKLVSFWRPAATKDLNAMIDVGGKKHVADQNFMKACVLKDRNAETSIEFAFPFDFAENKIGDFEGQGA